MDLDRIEQTVKNSRTFVALMFGLTILGYFVWFVAGQGQVVSASASDWGAFGDFVGGLLNPLVAYSAFYWLTVSVLVQKKELADTRFALQESGAAQKEQAKLAAINAKIEVISMRLEAINIGLEAELTYRNHIMNNGLLSSGNCASLMAKNGESTASGALLENSNRAIEELESSQRSLLDEANSLVNEITVNVTVGSVSMATSKLCADSSPST